MVRRGPLAGGEGQRGAGWGVLVNAALGGIKVAAGVASGSQALLADGIHSFADVLAQIAVWVGVAWSARPPDADHNYGHYKADAVAEKVVAIILILTGMDLAWTQGGALSGHAPVIPGILALWAVLLTGLLKAGLWAYQSRVATRTASLAMAAGAQDSLWDLVSSGVAALGILATRTGLWLWGDRVAAGLVGLMVATAGLRLFGQAARELMDRAVDPAVYRELWLGAATIDGVLAIKELRTRVSGAVILADVKIVVARDLSLLEAHAIAHQVRDHMMAVPGLADVMVHVNPAPEPAEGVRSVSSRSERRAP